MEFNITPLLKQLAFNHGATIALAKSTLSEKDFEIYLIEADIQAQYSLIDFLEIFPNLSDDLDKTLKNLNDNISKLKEQRDALK